MARRIGVLFLAGLVGAICLVLSEKPTIRGIEGFVSRAEAVVGRPLTPVSVAGVARRSARR
jgi:hypothetical protein